MAHPPHAKVRGPLRLDLGVWSMGWPFWARRRLRGVRLVATDVEWSAGAGAVVEGPVDALLLLLTGRATTALPRLAGPGVAVVAARCLPRGASTQG